MPKLPTIWRTVAWADVIHLMNHWTVLNALVYLCARLLGRPYVVCPAGSLVMFGRSLGIKRLYTQLIGKRMLKNAGAFIAVAADEAAVAIGNGVKKERIYHIPNGVCEEDFSYTDPMLFKTKAGLGEAPYILFLGRLNAIKGPDLLLEAFVEVAQRFPEHWLVFAGPDGGMKSELEEKAIQYGLQERVCFAGFVGGDAKSSAYYGADLLVVPSRKEAMSIVALEAAMTSTPVVLTDSCGFEALVDAGGAVMASVQAKSIAQSICAVLGDTDKQLVMGKRAHCFAIEKYSWDIAVKQFLGIFRSLV